MRRTFRTLLAAALVFTVAATAQADPDSSIPAKISDQIVAALAKGDIDATGAIATKYMGPRAGDTVKTGFTSITTLGKSQYTDLVYSRDFGKTEKDIIYKIDFEKAFAFVRLVWHVDSGEWHLIHLNYKTDNNLPFPTGWEHIYPK
ncbi:MAG TPA: hypothetical protein VHW66_20125 [Stellaceae bacterium]|jgi:hypothetical protein|nr:hypothetical protein [Stellaceae bacterium]